MTEPDNPNKVTATNFVAQMARYASFVKQKRELDTQLKLIQATLDALEEPLLEQMAENGMQSMRVAGMTLYILPQLWAGAVMREVTLPDGTIAVVGNKQETCDALIEVGQAQFVEPSFNVQTVSAWVREFPKDDTGMPILPPEVAGHINVRQVFRLAARK